jgi:glutaredoxin 3
MPEIEIYTQPWCPFCARAVNLLTRKGVAFREIDAAHGSPERSGPAPSALSRCTGSFLPITPRAP